MENFLGIESPYTDHKDARVVVLPVPFEKSSSWLVGSDKGPEAVLDASCYVELYDIETDSEVYKNGIHTADPINPETAPQMIASVSDKISSFLNDGKFVVVLGGEHTVSIAPIKAFSEKCENLSILHLDAHSDLRDEYEGDPYSHASAMARCLEYTDTIVSVGIRSMDASEKKNVVPENMFYAKDIMDNDEWMDRAIDRLTENVYITIDMDAFDPSIVPSVGTPEPGGMLWYQTLKFIKKVTDRRNVVGFDIVELCPYLPERASAFLAAKLIYKVLGYKFS